MKHCEHDTIRDLETKIRSLKHEIDMMRQCAETRNRELDAMHYVWCSGGCIHGVHRYDGRGPAAIDELIVVAAERNTKRLRAWWENRLNKTSWHLEVKNVTAGE